MKRGRRARRALLEHAEDTVIRLHYAASVIADSEPARAAQWRREADDIAEFIKACRERARKTEH